MLSFPRITESGEPGASNFLLELMDLNPEIEQQFEFQASDLLMEGEPLEAEFLEEGFQLENQAFRSECIERSKNLLNARASSFFTEYDGCLGQEGFTAEANSGRLNNFTSEA
ncbi:hypothetical protein BVY02_00970, partial [bacterium J17]